MERDACYNRPPITHTRYYCPRCYTRELKDGTCAECGYEQYTTAPIQPAGDKAADFAHIAERWSQQADRLASEYSKLVRERDEARREVKDLRCVIAHYDNIKVPALTAEVEELRKALEQITLMDSDGNELCHARIVAGKALKEGRK